MSPVSTKKITEAAVKLRVYRVNESCTPVGGLTMRRLKRTGRDRPVQYNQPRVLNNVFIVPFWKSVYSSNR